jgi:predicted transposase/invertase (TIGR01784 family)
LTPKTSPGLLSPLNDLPFRKIFGENAELLKDLLASFTGRSLDSFDGLTVTNPFLEPEYPGGKRGILDIRAETNDRTAFDIEAQRRMRPFLWERMQFYNSRINADGMKAGKTFQTAVQAVSIVIAGFNIFSGNEFRHDFRLRRGNGKDLFRRSNELIVLEVLKARKAAPVEPKDGVTGAVYWLLFFYVRSKKELMAMSEKSPSLQHAAEILIHLSEDRNLYEQALARDKLERDFASFHYAGKTEGMAEGMAKGMAKGREEGMAKGMAKGREESRLELVSNALKLNLAIDQIAALTGLPVEEASRLVDSLKG